MRMCYGFSEIKRKQKLTLNSCEKEEIKVRNRLFSFMKGLEAGTGCLGGTCVSKGVPAARQPHFFIED